MRGRWSRRITALFLYGRCNRVVANDVMDLSIAPAVPPLRLLKKADPHGDQKFFTVSGPDDDEAFERIRCPLCDWHPTPSSVWFCYGAGTPEPMFQACGTEWNTFATGGRCPGCQHQWRWTSCLRCAGWSLHEDWYEVGDAS